MTTSKPLVLLALKIAQMVTTHVLTHMRIVGGLGPARAGARPDQVSPVVVYVWSRVDIPVGRYEDIAGSDEFGVEDLEVYYGSVEIRSLLDGREVSMCRAHGSFEGS